MRIIYPVEFEINPKEMDAGMRWVTLRLKNIGYEALESLDVKLHTFDSYFIRVLGTGEFISHLAPQEEATRAFQIEATGSTEVYGSVSGFTTRGAFTIDSPWVWLMIKGNVAELVSTFAMTKPYTQMGEVVKIEAIVKGLKDSKNLDLEFWARKPSGTVEELAKILIEKLSGGEEQRYSAEITPKEEGFYTIYGYLYDNYKRIGLKTATILVEQE